MPKSINRQVRIKKHHSTLNTDEFYALTDLLFIALKENNRACARILDISPITWKSWNKKPPTWVWWNHILREAIKITISHTEGNRGTSRAHKRRIIEALNAIPNSDELIHDLEDMAYNTAGSVSHLRRLLTRGGMYKDEIFTVAHSGGYSHRALESAARTLEVVKTQEGYGKNKRSYWRLPDQDDD